jgi:MFS family permease
VGGYIDQYLSWRWIFYVKAIFGGVITLLNLVVLRETLYIPNAKQLPPPTDFKERLERLKFNPVRTKVFIMNFFTN